MFKLLILDVDGVLTTGLKTYDIKGQVISKTFSDRDFTAIKQFICSNVKVIFLSGDSQINSIIAKNRKVDFFYSRGSTGQLSKSECAKKILLENNLQSEQVIFVGDDLFDVEMRDYCKLMVCPNNSHYLMKENSDLVLSTKSGEGCIQELFEYMVANQLINPPTIEKVILRDSEENIKY